MKKLYSFVACLGISTAIMAQSLNGFEQFNHLRPANKIEKNKNVDRFTGSKFIDYEGYESYAIDLNGGGELFTFIRWINKNTTANLGFFNAIQTFDSLIVTSDYQVWDSENYFATPMRIDSVYMSIHHQNNSSAEDSIFIRIIELTPYTTNPLTSCRPTNTVLWADTIIVTSSLTGPPTPTGYPVQAFAFPVGYNLPANKRFGVSVTFSGPSSDSLAIVTGFPHYPGSPCANPNLTGIGQMDPGALYPSAFASVLNNGTPIEIPTTGGGTIYFDCNNDNNAQLPAEAALKVWSIWVRVSEVASVSENNITKFRVSQNMPNPAANSTTIKYELKENANVTLRVFDIAGKEVMHVNDGAKSSGVYTIELNTASLQNGVYFYRFEAGAEKVTRKMTIAK
jgi:hypothetical protein